MMGLLRDTFYRYRDAVDELGFVPLSKTGAELMFETISQCYERGSVRYVRSGELFTNNAVGVLF